MLKKIIATSVLFATVATVPAMASTLVPTAAATAVEVLGFETLRSGSGAQAVGQLSLGPFLLGEARGIYEFDISDAVLTEATLNVTNTGLRGVLPGVHCPFGCPSLSPPASFNVYGYSGNGIASGSDFFQTGTLLATIQAPAPNASISLDLTAFIASLLTGGTHYAGILLDATGNGAAFLAANITLTETPLPATLPLLSSVLGLGLLLHWRWKRRPIRAQGLA